MGIYKSKRSGLEIDRLMQGICCSQEQYNAWKEQGKLETQVWYLVYTDYNHIRIDKIYNYKTLVLTRGAFASVDFPYNFPTKGNVEKIERLIKTAKKLKSSNDKEINKKLSTLIYELLEEVKIGLLNTDFEINIEEITEGEITDIIKNLE